MPFKKRSPVRLVKSKIKNKEKVPKHIETVQTLPERRFKFQVSTKSHRVGIQFGAKVDRAGRYTTSNLPLWLQRKTDTEIRGIPEAKRQL